jgi:hypothetical protein
VLKITIPATELFNDETNKFINVKETTLELEHSLVSLSKWEQKWQVPFLGREQKTHEQTLDYIRCMNLSPEEIPPEVFLAITNDTINQIGEYINNKMTATWFSEVPGQKGPRTGEVLTAEVIYYWLVALTIPFEVQHWHLNRLLTLVRVTNIKNDPKKKLMPRNEAAAQQRMLNEQRKARLGTKG